MCCSAYWPPLPRRRPRPSTASPSRAHRSPATPWCGARSARTEARACSSPRRGRASHAWCCASPLPPGVIASATSAGVPGALDAPRPHGSPYALQYGITTRGPRVTSSAIESSVTARNCRVNGGAFTNPLDVHRRATSRPPSKVTPSAIGANTAPAVLRVWIACHARTARRARAARAPGAPRRPVRGVAGAASSDGIGADHGRRARHRGDALPPTPRRSTPKAFNVFDLDDAGQRGHHARRTT